MKTLLSNLHSRSVLRQLLFVLGVVILAACVTFAVRPWFSGRAPLTFFCLAVILSAGYGGFRAGLAATCLSLLLVLTLFANATFILALAQSSVVLFAIIGVVVSIVLGRLYRANATLRELSTALEASNQNLSRQRDALRQSNEELHRFACALAHDLRNPLASISVFTRLLVQRNEASFDTSSHELARSIVNGTERMSSMIKGLLEYAAVPERDVTPCATDCNDILQRVLLDYQHEIQALGAVIQADRLPLAQVPPEHLTQIFSNLVGNALKYRSSNPRITVTVADQNHEWVFCVQDNGIGFSMAHAEDVFAMFRRLHNTPEYEGHGIGLALCKAIVERHGGNIWVRTEPGKGAAFFFSLPKATAVPAKPNPTPTTVSL